MPNQNNIIVLDDRETWSQEGFYIQISDDEMKKILNDEKVYNVIEDDGRWRPL